MASEFWPQSDQFTRQPRTFGVTGGTLTEIHVDRQCHSLGSSYEAANWRPLRLMTTANIALQHCQPWLVRYDGRQSACMTRSRRKTRRTFLGRLRQYSQSSLFTHHSSDRQETSSSSTRPIRATHCSPCLRQMSRTARSRRQPAMSRLVPSPAWAVHAALAVLLLLQHATAEPALRCRTAAAAAASPLGNIRSCGLSFVGQQPRRRTAQLALHSCSACSAQTGRTASCVHDRVVVSRPSDSTSTTAAVAMTAVERHARLAPLHHNCCSNDCSGEARQASALAPQLLQQ